MRPHRQTDPGLLDPVAVEVSAPAPPPPSTNSVGGEEKCEFVQMKGDAPGMQDSCRYPMVCLVAITMFCIAGRVV